MQFLTAVWSMIKGLAIVEKNPFCLKNEAFKPAKTQGKPRSV